MFVKFPYGSPFGEPGNVDQQRTILRDLLLHLKTAEVPGEIVDLPYRWRRSTYNQVQPSDFCD